MYNHTGMGMIIVAMKMSSHSSFVIVFDFKYVTLEAINVFCLAYILYVAPVALLTTYEIITLTCAFIDCVVTCIIIQVCNFP